MNKSELLAERVADKFQRYVQVDTQASEKSKTRPSTPGQLKLAEILRHELQTVGLADAMVDQFGFVYATLPGNRPAAPVIGYLAHMDTFQGVSGRGVKPILHRNYAGGSVDLPNGLRDHRGGHSLPGRLDRARPDHLRRHHPARRGR